MKLFVENCLEFYYIYRGQKAKEQEIYLLKNENAKIKLMHKHYIYTKLNESIYLAKKNILVNVNTKKLDRVDRNFFQQNLYMYPDVIFMVCCM